MDAVDHQALFAEFARQLDNPALRLDARGACGVAIDGIAFTIEFDARHGEFLAYAPVGTAPAGAGVDYLRRLHQANYASLLQGTGSVGLDLQAGTVMFVERIRAAGLSPAEFASAMRSVVNRAEEWKSLLAGPQLDEATQAPFNPNETAWMIRA